MEHTSAALPVQALPFPYCTDGKQKLERNAVRRITAQRLAYSFREIPHFSLNRTVALSALNGDRAERKEQLSLNDYLVCAVAKALSEYPIANASFYEEEVWLNPQINVGYAVATPKGLMVPVVKAAENLTLLQMAQTRKTLVQKALDGKISPEELEEGTFTITNLGAFGIDGFTAVINPPQAAILAVGRMTELLVEKDEAVRREPVVNLTLSVDHRVLDGKEAAMGGNMPATLAAVLSGVVFGDHCSPICDTTIISSAGAQCNHLEHCKTQIPYAVTAASAAAVGFLVAGFIENLFLPLLAGLVVFALLLIALHRYTIIRDARESAAPPSSSV